MTGRHGFVSSSAPVAGAVSGRQARTGVFPITAGGIRPLLLSPFLRRHRHALGTAFEQAVAHLLNESGVAAMVPARNMAIPGVIHCGPNTHSAGCRKTIRSDSDSD